jgi:hypothetical protein
MIGSVPLGTSRTFPMQVMGPDQVTPSTAYLASDQLIATMWTGDDMAPVSTPEASWLDSTIAAYKIVFVPSDVVPGVVAPGAYRIRVTATRILDTVEILRDTVEILDVPGLGVALPTYCSFDDMTRECGWIGQYLDDAEDQTGFLEQRAAAREWMDNLIMYAAPVSGMGQLISRESWWSWSYSGVDPRSGTGLALDRVLMGYLADNRLITTGPSGSRIKVACACYALALVLRSQVGLSTDQARFAGYFMRRAMSEASMVRVEIKINDDVDTPQYAFTLGTTNTRFM